MPKPTDEVVIKLNPKSLFIDKGIVTEEEKEDYLVKAQELLAFEDWKDKNYEEWTRWIKRKVVKVKRLTNMSVSDKQRFSLWISDPINSSTWKSWLKNELPIYKNKIKLVNTVFCGLDYLDMKKFDCWAEKNIADWTDLKEKELNIILSDDGIALLQRIKSSGSEYCAAREKLLMIYVRSTPEFVEYEDYV